MSQSDVGVSPHADGAFAEIPFVTRAALNRPANRRRFVVGGLLGLLVSETAVAYLSRPTTVIDHNAPCVRVEVRGMHCPIRCGLRVASVLETLPGVVRGSVTANPKTGVVTFAVTDVRAVQEAEIRRAVEKAGFGVVSVDASIPPPAIQPAADGPGAGR